MFNSVKRVTQKTVMTVTSWYRIPERGMDRFELLATSSCLPILASKRYDYKYHFVCPFHVVAPYLFKSYFPDESYPWLPSVGEDNVILTAEFRDVNGNVTNRIGVNNKIIMHEWRDLCCFHLHKETEALLSLKLYGMNDIKDVVTKPSNYTAAPTKIGSKLPSTLDEVDKFLGKLDEVDSRIDLTPRAKVDIITDESSDPFAESNIRTLREEGKPYNSVLPCEINEISPQKGEPLLLSGYRRDPRVDEDGRDVSLMIPYCTEGTTLRIENGRSMIMTPQPLPAGMIGGGAFDLEGNCKGMIEGVVQKSGTIIQGHKVPDTHAQNVYESCAAVIDADVLSDFVGNMELGLLDDMQDELKELKKKMGEDTIKSEQQKIMRPIVESLQQQK